MRRWVLICEPEMGGVAGEYGDASEKIGWRVDADTVRFPSGVKLRSTGEVVDTAPIPERGNHNGLWSHSVALLSCGYPEAASGARIIPVADVMKASAGEETLEHLKRHGGWEPTWESIRAEGLRHPIVLDRTLCTLLGLSRLCAHYRGGAQTIEAFIWNVPREGIVDVYEAGRPRRRQVRRVVHGLRGVRRK